MILRRAESARQPRIGVRDRRGEWLGWAHATVSATRSAEHVVVAVTMHALG